MSEYLAHTREDAGVQTVRDHLINTAERSGQFAEAFDARDCGYTAGLLHDIGKYSAEFQRHIRHPELSMQVDHSTAGAQEARKREWTPIAFAVAGHHRGLPDLGTKSDSAGGTTLMSRLDTKICACDAWKDEILIADSRWPSYANENRFSMAFFIRILYSCLVDADFLDTEAFMQAGEPPRGEGESILQLLEKVRAKAEGWLNAPPSTPLNAIRNSILHSCMENGRLGSEGCCTLTVPTGGGKTFASLAFALEHAVAHGKKRVIYIIPYTSIIDQTAGVFSDIFGEKNVLAHYSGADYQLTRTEDLTSLQYRHALASENWDAPVIVTTAVQFFESLYANRSSQCRKLHNIAESVLIFDEAQTLPVPYLHPCIAAIAQLVRHYKVTAVFCTATQPELAPLFQKYFHPNTPREICPGTDALYADLRRTTITEIGSMDTDALCARLRRHTQFLCVVNRRALAQEIYGDMPEEGRFCLTTLLCPADRKAVLAEIRTRLREGLPCRVVSTSLIEAGVDVDFPVAYRERAGLDSILQTAGRCNREGRRPKEESLVHIFTLTDSPSPAMLKQNIAALETVLRKHPCGEIDTPQAVHTYFNTLFYRLKDGTHDLDKKEILSAFEKGVNGSLFPFETVAQRFRLIETPVKTIYIPLPGEGARLCDALQSGAVSRSLYRALGQYGVSVYPQHFDALSRAGALILTEGGDAVLTRLDLYSPDTGLAMEVEEGAGFFL